MPVTLVTGKLGGGKSLVSVGQIKDALLAGRRVATNLDINLEAMLGPKAKKVDLIRLPDKPTLRDLELLGYATEDRDESKNGLLVLDELGTWLNARQWGDKERQPAINWLLHSRKYGWDLLLITQHQNLIDKQVRESIVEFLVVCRRLDRLKIPFVGWLIKLLTGGYLSGRMPRIHVGVVRYGTSSDALVTDRWVYMGRDLYGSYDTRQVFSDTYDKGTYTVLSPWLTTGRYLPTKPSLSVALRSFCAVVGHLFGGPPPAGYEIGRFGGLVRTSRRRSVTRPALPVQGHGRPHGPQLRPTAQAVRNAFLQAALPQAHPVGPDAIRSCLVYQLDPSPRSGGGLGLSNLKQVVFS